MQKKRDISEYRARLDKTLVSPELTDSETLKSLIREQLWSSSPHERGECNADILDKRTADVSNILDKLRSASMKDHEASRSSDASYSDWKLKGDYEDCRVMYREGLQGSPFHTLLVEGFVDGPVEDCLCVSWESSLYKKWWPQSSFPSFKVLQNTCLQKVRIGEQICLVRMKVPWPVSDREAVVHYFLFEYFKDGLIVVLINTISNLESIGFSTNDFTENGIPEALNAVRIDMVGGFALQKVNTERSFFRTIADMDIKFDLVPPSLINFISRQLIGNGFRLYKKAVASVAKVDEDYSKALADPLYTQIRRALYLNNETDEVASEENELNGREFVVSVRETEGKDDEPNLVGGEQDAESPPKNESDQERKNQTPLLSLSDAGACENESVHSGRAFSEIQEEKREGSVRFQEGSVNKNEGKRRFWVSPEVEQALGTLERAISMVRKHRTDSRGHRISSSSSSSFSDGELGVNVTEDPRELNRGIGKSKGLVREANTQVMDKASHDGSSIHIIRRNGSSSFARENHHNRIAPASPEQHLITDTTETTGFGQTTESDTQTRAEPGETRSVSVLNGGKNPMLQPKRRVCCFAFKPWH